LNENWKSSSKFGTFGEFSNVKAVWEQSGVKKFEDLHNQKLHGFYSSYCYSDKVKRVRMDRACGSHDGNSTCMQFMGWNLMTAGG
jgi:hypothetical protein